MPETTSEQDQKRKSEEAGEPARPLSAVEAPQRELGGPPLSLSVGPGLGSPDGFEKRAGDNILRRNANRQPRAQTLTAMQRQFGNQHVQRFMVQRRAAGEPVVVQREDGGKADPQEDKEEDLGNVTVDEKGVTNATYNKPGFTTKDEKATPAAPPKDVKPENDLVDVTATAVCTYQATVTISLPSVPTGLTACQTKRVKDAIDNKLAPHEKQHESAMKQYDGTYEEAFTLKQVLRSTITAQLTAKAKEIADAQQAIRQKAAQDASDALDKPPFVVIVDLNCKDDKPAQKPGKKQAADAGSEAQPAGAGGDQPPAEAL